MRNLKTSVILASSAAAAAIVGATSMTAAAIGGGGDASLPSGLGRQQHTNGAGDDAQQRRRRQRQRESTVDAPAAKDEDLERAPRPNITNAASRRDADADDQYRIIPAEELARRIDALAVQYPEFVTLTTARERYGLGRAGGSKDCPFDHNDDDDNNNGEGCDVRVMTIFDKGAYPDDPDVEPNGAEEGDGSFGSGNESGWRYLPDVFLSGSVHGDERVGPSSLLEAAELLLASARCESLPRESHKPRAGVDSNDEFTALWQQELTEARDCRSALLMDHAISSPQRRWLARLVTTRRTVVIPTANSLGYFRNERTEDGIDPNRDFPYDVEDAKDCMKTVAGRTINEAFRSHLFQLGLTFHGGMEVIAYEWGAPTYLHATSPDLLAQQTIASSYSRYAGAFPRHRAYDYGDMNEKVYYVRGGMEDWAFAGSWDPDRVIECRPTTKFGGSSFEDGVYPPERTSYNNSTLRAFNMLVETSNVKGPVRESLGTRTRPLEGPMVGRMGEENGHIARNMRLALLGVEAVEPYVVIEGVEGMLLQDGDVVPGVNPRRSTSSDDNVSFFEHARMVWVPAADTNDDDGKRTVSWTVGGAYEIDETVLLVGPWDALPEKLENVNDGFYPSDEMEQILWSSSADFQLLRPETSSKKGDVVGRTRWHRDGAFPISTSYSVDPDAIDAPPTGFVGPTFEATVDVSTYAPGTILAAFAVARVDAAWAKPGSSETRPKDVGSVSHIVNARTDPSYLAYNAGKIVRGRKDNWRYSRPVSVVVGGREDDVRASLDIAILNSFSHGAAMGTDGRIRVVELNARTAGVSMVGFARTAAGARAAEKRTAAGAGAAAASFFVAIAFLAAVVVSVRRRRRFRGMERVTDVEGGGEEDGGFSMEMPADVRYRDSNVDGEGRGSPSSRRAFRID